MSERFLKFIPSEEALHLARKHPKAFILLMFIAERARRENGDPDGLIIGQCHIGDWQNMGFTRQEYRTALRVLILKKFIEITETCRTRQKSTTGSTTVGTLVKLCDSRVYDINTKQSNHRSNHCPTTGQPPANHEQEGIRKKKKEEEIITTPTPSSLPVPQKIKFRDHVALTQDEYDLLLAKHGADMLKLMLDKLDAFKGSTGKAYKSDYFTMKEGGWVVNQVRKDCEKNSRNASGGKFISETPGREPTFVAGRVLRGGNPDDDEERSVGGRSVND